MSRIGVGSGSANLGCMSFSSLGRLQIVPPREIWPHEALDFTPWLLQNVDVLSDLLGMDLVLEVAEHPVGDFGLDLKGYDEATGEVVIVETNWRRRITPTWVRSSPMRRDRPHHDRVGDHRVPIRTSCGHRLAQSAHR
ncbi:hypothetical protein [Rhodococcus sp. O3]|uniref:hypothetical protein n=1 Tax=Rhodococcus sp. O3 TaxID=3404919 RepID=UPI003B6710F8